MGYSLRFFPAQAGDWPVVEFGSCLLLALVWVVLAA
ncbi:hypothetical protein BJ970_004924 [Saccharopolyspora phatthalungensis]|uniref:Uncharacterized protein n=1 Tax=Saccharopolyspora phatthalungensis TaxID=664693 RepID=A0A840QC86_9PSEU|nr:hypothetical protein [Saccharopolyspora phatthalungensis]